MNKIVTFSGILLILFFVFACTLPSEVEITGSPSLEFAANMNFGDCFTDMVENVMNADGKTKTLPCTNPSINYLAFVLRMEIFKEDDYKLELNFDPDAVTSGSITVNKNNVDVTIEDTDGHKNFVVVSDSVIAESESDKPYNLSFKGLEDYLEGFKFYGIHSKIYFYGTKLVDVASIELCKLGEPEPIVKKDDDFLKVPSGVESLEEFTGLTLPDGGTDISDTIEDIINKGEDLTLTYKVFLNKDEKIDEDLIDKTHTITAELVIWLPLELESIRDNAVFKFSGFFDGISNFIKSLAETGYTENINIKMEIEPKNPFNPINSSSNGIFIMNDEAYGDIESPLDDDSLSIILNEKEVEYIKDNPFEPSFFVLYPKKKTLLEIPKGNIMITTVLLDTELNHNVEF